MFAPVSSSVPAALAAAVASANSAAASATARDVALDAGAALANANPTADYKPGWAGPDRILIAPAAGGYAVVFSGVTTNTRLTGLEARGSSTPYGDYRPGRAGQWKVGSDGGVIAAPAIGGRASSTLYARNGTLKIAVGRWIETRPLVTVWKGQSLSAQEGQDPAHLALFVTTPAYPGKVLIPDVGMKPTGQTILSLKDALDEGYDSSHNSVGPTLIGAVGTCTVAYLNRRAKRIRDDTGLNSMHIGLIVGIGGQPIEDLGPGTDSFDRLPAYLDRLQDILSKAPYFTEIGGVEVIFEHGNASAGVMIGPQYRRWLMQDQRETTRLVRERTSMKGEVPYYLTQFTGGRSSATNGEIYFDVVQEAIRLTKDVPDKFFLLPSGQNLTKPAGTHNDCASYYIEHIQNAESVHVNAHGGGVLPLEIVECWMKGPTTIGFIGTVAYPPIVRDTTHNAIACTTTLANPGVVSATAHGLANTVRVYWETTGTAAYPLQRPLFVVNASANALSLALTAGGAAIDTSAQTQSGTHKMIVMGDGWYFDDDAATPPYVKSLTILDNGTSAGVPTAYNDPLGYFEGECELSAAPATNGRLRLLIAELSSGSDGTAAAARSTLRDSNPATSEIAYDASVASTPVPTWQSRQVVDVKR